MKQSIDRRTFCKWTGAAAVLSKAEVGFAEASFTRGSAVDLAGKPIAPDAVEVRLKWSGSDCHPVVINHTHEPQRLREVVLFVFHHGMPAETAVYGEGFQMLTQTAGTLASIKEIGYPEQKHYRIPGPSDAAVVTNLLILTPPGDESTLFAYTSSHRFAGRFYLRDGSVSAVIDMEGIELGPRESMRLETLVHWQGREVSLLLDRLAARLNSAHPRRPLGPIPTGWCSWYCFERSTSSEEVQSNLAAIQRERLGLKYIQIDDGYQPAMGDWLEPGRSFGGHVQDVLKQIRESGCQPAIWVAPFIAAKDSHVLRDHPEWFVKNASGEPMAAAEVTFTGWGGGGWYCLDGTHPEVQAHFEKVFRTMREEWGCTYFKLDANFWGAVHGGHFHDPKATRIEAYRRGMEAVRRGAGDSFLLGCNHPIWPSLGLIDGSRSSGDISRNWKTVSGCMTESMHRNWQNGRLWWNDPDAVLLSDRLSKPMQGQLTQEELRFHATSAFASAGLMLSGDDLSTLPEDRLAMLRTLLPPARQAMVFDDPATLRIGRSQGKDGMYIAAFNKSDREEDFSIPLHGKYVVSEVWTQSKLGVCSEILSVKVPAHGARLFQCVMAR